MLPPGFEPGSSARKAGILDRARLREQMGRAGFEPAILATSRRCLNRARPSTRERREWDLNPQGLTTASLAD